MSSIQIQSFSKKIDLLSLHESDTSRYPFLLESTAVGSQGRFDILFAFPQQEDSISVTRINPTPGSDFLSQLDNVFQNNQINQPSTESIEKELPFYGGWFIYLSYEIAQEIEPVLKLPVDNDDELKACLVRCPSAVIYDHQKNESYVVSENAYEKNNSEIVADVESIKKVAVSSKSLINEIHEEDPSVYTKYLEKIHDYIVDGDVFQVNLSRRWEAGKTKHTRPSDIYRNLRRANPAPFSGIMNWNGFSVVSSSPERLVSVKQGVAETRPIAGTRPRSNQNDQHDNVDDKAKLDELIGHPKERAEHVMLIDLERNDLGRICEPGSIEVNELMCLESYAHVHHIVSNVRGMLRRDVSPGEVIRATFPGGTITGCPKVRCMEIIAELEQTSRGPYTGSFGYLNRDGNMDMNILIRTIHVEDSRLSFRAGAGIVVDSQAEKEVEETRAKAKGMLKALEPIN